ncbi:MAG: hydrogenase maturation nickel metallochaperone HypA [Gemmatimonadetes bacterium]|nr:hydrogenase maturation nickel metallochaperone HypA [Gemmatimonadota bacterium]
MHEFSIVSSLADSVRVHLPGGMRLTSARASVGALEHLDFSLMQTAWQAVTDGSDLAGAELHLEREPVRVRCRSCRHAYVPPHPSWMVCPACGSARPEVLAGVGVTLLTCELEPHESS